MTARSPSLHLTPPRGRGGRSSRPCGRGGGWWRRGGALPLGGGWGWWWRPRRGAGGAGAVLRVMGGGPIAARFGRARADGVPGLLPREGGWGMFPPSEPGLARGPATVVFAGWVATVLTAGAVAFVSRDA